MTESSERGPTIYPALLYRDPGAAIPWLEKAFGFKTVMNVPDDEGGVAHAELGLGTGMIMLGSAKKEMGWVSPLDLPAVNQTIYVYVADPDTHHAQAKAAGAEITRELNDTDYGSREYGAKDLEGHHWSFGTYRPSP